MNNVLDKSLNDLGLDPIGDIIKYTKLREIIAKPIWSDRKSNKGHKAKKRLIPDLISFENDGEKKLFKIFHAKYYYIILYENEVRKKLGVGDITKQYLYQLAYTELLNENNINVVENSFLMPTDEGEEIIIGTASLEIFKIMGIEPQLKDIDIVLLQCEETFSKYLTYFIEVRENATIPNYIRRFFQTPNREIQKHIH